MGVSKRKREILAVARGICPDATVETTRGTHLLITFRGPEGSRKVYCALTPSDHRDAKNVKRDMMQAARAVGCLPER